MRRAWRGGRRGLMRLGRWCGPSVEAAERHFKIKINGSALAHWSRHWCALSCVCTRSGWHKPWQPWQLRRRTACPHALYTAPRVPHYAQLPPLKQIQALPPACRHADPARACSHWHGSLADAEAREHLVQHLLARLVARHLRAAAQLTRLTARCSLMLTLPALQERALTKASWKLRAALTRSRTLPCRPHTLCLQRAAWPCKDKHNRASDKRPASKPCLSAPQPVHALALLASLSVGPALTWRRDPCGAHAGARASPSASSAPRRSSAQKSSGSRPAALAAAQRSASAARVSASACRSFTAHAWPPARAPSAPVGHRGKRSWQQVTAGARRCC